MTGPASDLVGAGKWASICARSTKTKTLLGCASQWSIVIYPGLCTVDPSSMPQIMLLLTSGSYAVVKECSLDWWDEQRRIR